MPLTESLVSLAPASRSLFTSRTLPRSAAMRSCIPNCSTVRAILGRWNEQRISNRVTAFTGYVGACSWRLGYQLTSVLDCCSVEPFQWFRWWICNCATLTLIFRVCKSVWYCSHAHAFIPRPACAGVRHASNVWSCLLTAKRGQDMVDVMMSSLLMTTVSLPWVQWF